MSKDNLNNRPRVFLSYASEDVDKIEKIYAGLRSRQVNVWFDREKMGLGTWLDKIMKAIVSSKYFIICLSEASLRKTGFDNPGFQDRELSRAYEIAMSQPENLFTIVPVRIEKCERGDPRVSSFQQHDLFPDFEKSLDKLALQLGGIALSGAKPETSESLTVFNHIFGRASALYNAGELEKSLLMYESLNNIFPNSRSPHGNIGVIRLELGDMELALQAFDKVLTLDPADTRAWLNKGFVFIELGEFDKALECVEEAKTLNSDPAITANLHATILCALKRYDEAMGVVDEDLKLDPKSEIAWNNKGTIYLNTNQLNEALEAYQKAVSIKPNDPILLYNSGNVLGRQGKYSEALQILKQAEILSPSSHKVLRLIVNLLLLDGSPEAAITYSDKALSIDKDDAKIWYYRGQALILLKRNDEALVSLQNATSIDNTDADAWFCLGNLYAHTSKDYAAALMAFSKATMLNEHDKIAWQQKAHVLNLLGRQQEALEAWNKVLAI
jgi:tetratricopeptide (TPR) repeat protein